MGPQAPIRGSAGEALRIEMSQSRSHGLGKEPPSSSWGEREGLSLSASPPAACRLEKALEDFQYESHLFSAELRCL